MNTPVPPQDSAARAARLPFRARRLRQHGLVGDGGFFGLIGVGYLLQQNWWVAGLLLTGTAATRLPACTLKRSTRATADL